MGTAERTARIKCRLRGINPANTDSTECRTRRQLRRQPLRSVPPCRRMRSWPHYCSLTVIPCATVKIGQHNGAPLLYHRPTQRVGDRRPQGVAFRTGNRRGAERDLRRRGLISSGTLPPEALRIAPGELHWIDPLGSENGRKPSFRYCPVSVIASRCRAELFIRSDAAYRFSANLSVESRRDSSQPWYDGDELGRIGRHRRITGLSPIASSDRREEEAHKRGPFYRNPGKTGDKQSSQPSAPRSKYRQPSRTVPADFRQAFPSQAPFHKGGKERDSQNTPRRTMTNSLEGSKSETQTQYNRHTCCGNQVIPPASSIVRKGAGNEEMPSDKTPPAIGPRVSTPRPIFGLKSKILKIQPSKSRRVPYDQSKRPAPYCISTISEL